MLSLLGRIGCRDVNVDSWKVWSRLNGGLFFPTPPEVWNPYGDDKAASAAGVVSVRCVMCTTGQGPACDIFLNLLAAMLRWTV